MRPNGKLGTVEVRICDMPLGLEAVLGLTALIQCLVVVLSREQGQGIAGSDGRRSPAATSSYPMVLQQNRWLAARHGLDAMLADPHTRRKAPARVLARELIDRLLPAGRDIGCADQLQRLGDKDPWSERRRGTARDLLADQRLADVVRLMIRADSSGHWHPSLSPLLDTSSLLGATEAPS